jgi:hypothetical protein
VEMGVPVGYDSRNSSGYRPISRHFMRERP